MRRGHVIAMVIAATLVAAVGLVAAIVLVNRPDLLSGRIAAPPGGIADLPAASAAPAGPRQEEDEDLGTVDVYDVVPDASLRPAAAGLAAEVWATFLRVATPDFAVESVSAYKVGDAPASDLLASVTQNGDDARWSLAVNLATSEDTGQLVATLVHELMHLISLGVSQESADVALCTTVRSSEGCARDDSYLAAFRTAFWSGYGPGAPNADNGDDGVAQRFYAEHEDDFVSEYAATNVIEDIAESFMAYVLEPTVPDPVQGIVAAKLAFFDGYPELAAIRERIRAEFRGELPQLADVG